VAGDELPRHEPPGGRAASIAARLRGSSGRWLSIFGISLGLFLVRFLVPTPVGQSALALLVSLALAVSMICHTLVREPKPLRPTPAGLR
jgi:hypothetical protein